MSNGFFELCHLREDIDLIKGYGMMNKKQAKRISDDLHRKGGPADRALKIRCELKARLDVILEWGDPRKWQN